MAEPMKKILNWIGIVEEDEEDEDISPIGYEQQPQQHEQVRDYLNPQSKKAPVITLHSQKQMKVILVEPKEYKDVQQVADHLKGHRPVIIKLMHADKEAARRIVDFMYGTVYALGGATKKIADGIYIFTPDNVDIAESEISSGYDPGRERSQQFFWDK